MKKFTLSILMFALTFLTYGQTTVTKSYTGPTVTVDGCGSYCVSVGGVSFDGTDFPSGSQITDVNITINWLKTDGTCNTPGTGFSFHSETNFRLDSPTTQVILASPNTWNGGANIASVTTTFDQSAGANPSGTPVNGTFLPNGGNLNSFNTTDALGSWVLRAGDTAGGDPLCVISYSITITAIPNTPPNAVCQNFTAQLDASGNVTVNGSDINNGSNDAEDGTSLTLAVSPNTFDCSDVGTPQTVTLTVTDSGGLTDTCTATVTVVDSLAPVISCVLPDPIVDTDPGVCTYTVQGTEFDATFTDNCPDGSITNDLNNTDSIADEVLSKGTTTVVWTANDGNGQIVTCTTVITVEDNEAPVITCVLPDPIVDTDPGVCTYTVQGTEFDATFTDNCPDGSITNDLNNTDSIANEVLPKGTTTVVWTANDGNGQIVTCTTVITVEDNEDPVISCVGGGVTSNVGFTNIASGSSYSFYLDGLVFNSSEEFVLQTVLINPTSSGDVVVNILDSSGLSTLQSVTVPITSAGIQRIPLNLTIPAGSYQINADGSTVTGIVRTGGSASFPYSDPSGTVNITGAINGLGGFYYFFYDWEIEIGTAANTIRDTDPGVCTYTVQGTEFDATFTDNCPDGSITNDLNNTDSIANEVLPKGTTTVVWTANDGNGQIVTCTTVITVEDNEDPVITCVLPDPIVDTDPGVCTYTVQGTEFDATFTDNCPDGSITNDLNNTDSIANEVLPKGDTTVVWTVDDGNGQTATCTTVITVEDNEDPTWVNPPADLTVECDGAGNTTDFSDWLDNTFTGTDNCPNWVITNDSTGLSDDCGETGTETVTFTLTDESGNFIELDATFTIEDTVDPFWDVAPSDLTVECDGAGNTAEFDAWLNATFSGSDTCSGFATVTNNSTGLSDDCGETGAETVTFTLTDDCGNFIELDATFTIEDTTPAVIGCPGDVTAFTEDGDCGAIVNFQSAVAIEECGDVIVYQTAGFGSGSIFPVGDTLIEFTAQDSCGNLSTCEFTVTVIDDDAPEAICQSITVELDDMGNATITANQVNFGSVDNCGVDTLEIDIDTFDCSNVGDNDVTLTVTDIHGNTATCIAVVTVVDVTAPEVTCNDITVELDADGTVTIDPMDIAAGSSDACGIASYELNIDTFGCLDVGESTVILTVTDVNGNESSCSATVTVEDNTAPELVCMDVTVELNQDGVAFITPALVADIIDNCGTGAIIIDVEEVSCADIGTPVTVNVFANDGNGNSTVCSAIVTVVDLLGPQIVCPEDEVVNLDPNGTYTLGDYIGDGIATVTDNCTDPVTIFSQDPAPGTILGFGVQVITFTAEDEYGNVSTCSFELDVQEILGANDGEDFASLVLYPNPADSKVHLSNPRQMDLSEVTIYDLTGRIVNKVDLTNMGSEITIDVSTLANATYMLVIKGEQGTSTKQLIVSNY